MPTLQEKAREMVAANGGSLSYAQAVRALKARNAKIRAKREAEEAAQQEDQAALEADLVKPSVLAKELGIHMSVLYGMIKRGTIRNWAGHTSSSSMVSRSEVERARAGGRKAKAAKRAAGIPDEPPKSPLKKGQILLMRKVSMNRAGPEGAQTTVRVVKEIMRDSETGMAIALDSMGREMFYTAEDVKTLLADDRLLEVDAPFLMDAIGKHMMVEGHEEFAQRLAGVAQEYQRFLDSLNSKPKAKCAWCGETSNDEQGKLRRRKGEEEFYHLDCMTAASKGAVATKSKIRVRKVSADMEERPSVRRPRMKVSRAAAEADDVPGFRVRESHSERQARKRLSRRAQDTAWR